MYRSSELKSFQVMTWEAQLTGAASSVVFVVLNCAMNIYTKWLFSPGEVILRSFLRGFDSFSYEFHIIS